MIGPRSIDSLHSLPPFIYIMEEFQGRKGGNLRGPLLFAWHCCAIGILLHPIATMTRLVNQGRFGSRSSKEIYTITQGINYLSLVLFLYRHMVFYPLYIMMFMDDYTCLCFKSIWYVQCTCWI